MKIAFVADDTLDSTDGVQQYVLTLGNWYTQQGHEVHYIVGQTKRNDIENIHSVSKNIKVAFNKNNLTVPLPTSSSKIRQLINKEQFDVLHVQIPYSPFMAAKAVRAAKNTKTAVIGTFHILPYSVKERHATKALGLLLSRTNKYFDKFIAVSLPAKDFARSAFGIDCQVVPNPVNLSATNLPNTTRTSSKPVKIVFLGRLVERKGVIQLIRAFDKIYKMRSDISLDVYGSGPLKDDAQKLVNSLGLNKAVRLMGFLDEEKKYDVLANSDIAVFPSLGGESFGIVLTEAIAAGAGVVIGGNNLGYASVLEYPETLFSPSDINDFANCMMKFVDDEHLRQTTRAKQVKLLKKYKVDVVGTQLLEIYTEEIAKRKKAEHNK